MRDFCVIKLSNPSVFSNKLLLWSSQYNYVSFLNSNPDYISNNKIEYDLIAGIDTISHINSYNAKNNFDALKKYSTETNDWLFGHFCYDLKNEIENLASNNNDGVQFSELVFFQPKYLFLLKDGQLEIGYFKKYSSEEEIKNIVQTIENLQFSAKELFSSFQLTGKLKKPKVKSRISKDEYFSKINFIKQHIQKGDIYEMNFCMEFYAEAAVIDPIEIYSHLNEISQTPFSAFYKIKNNYLFSASPERFLKKTGTRLISQPIKGTIKRGANLAEDEQLKKQLSENKKERNENVMIVDLVRNDLSKSAVAGSVKVEELFGVHTFKQVHQLISSVSAEIKPDIHFTDAIRNTFPMGSMTGAPKVRAMELIEQYESTKRGLYSGAVGYITPSGDFDFNVVIRSILYNDSNKYLSFMVGSAITSGSNPEQEYEECMLKAKAMLEVLGTSHI